MICDGCYKMSDISVKLVNTRKAGFPNAYRKKCGKCKSYYIEKGDYKR